METDISSVRGSMDNVRDYVAKRVAQGWQVQHFSTAARVNGRTEMDVLGNPHRVTVDSYIVYSFIWVRD
jgi:hypothetical protein